MSVVASRPAARSLGPERSIVGRHAVLGADGCGLIADALQAAHQRSLDVGVAYV